MNSIAKNYSINLIYQIILIIFPIILIPYTSRILGPDASGEYAFVYTSSLYFIMLAQLGISLYGAKQISISRDNSEKMSSTFWQLFFAKLVSTIFSIVMYLTFITFFIKSSNILYYLQLILLVSTALDISWFYIGNEKFKQLLLRNLLVKLISLILIIIFVKTPEDLYKFAFISFSAEFLGQILMWYKINNNILGPRKRYFMLSDLVMNLRGMFILFVPQLIIQVYTILNNTMLGIFSSNEQVAYYDYSTKILNIALTIITSLGIVMLPRIASLNKDNDTVEIKKYIHQSVKMMSIIGVPIMVSMMAIGDVFVDLYLGDMYEKVGFLLMFYPIKILLVIYSNIMGMQFLIPLGKNKLFIISVLIGALSSILLNLLLIKSYGAFGVVLSVIIAEILVTLTQIIFTFKSLNILKSFVSSSKMLFGGLLMYLIMLFTKNNILPRMFILLNILEYDKKYLSVITIAFSFFMGIMIYLLFLALSRDETTLVLYLYFRKKILKQKGEKHENGKKV